MTEFCLGSEWQRSQFRSDCNVPQSNSIPFSSLGSCLLMRGTDAQLLREQQPDEANWSTGQAELTDADLSPWCLEEEDSVNSSCP